MRPVLHKLLTGGSAFALVDAYCIALSQQIPCGRIVLCQLNDLLGGQDRQPCFLHSGVIDLNNIHLEQIVLHVAEFICCVAVDDRTEHRFLGGLGYDPDQSDLSSDITVVDEITAWRLRLADNNAKIGFGSLHILTVTFVHDVVHIDFFIIAGVLQLCFVFLQLLADNVLRRHGQTHGTGKQAEGRLELQRTVGDHGVCVPLAHDFFLCLGKDLRIAYIQIKIRKRTSHQSFL